jgi:hypothetical protein
MSSFMTKHQPLLRGKKSLTAASNVVERNSLESIPRSEDHFPEFNNLLNTTINNAANNITEENLEFGELIVKTINDNIGITATIDVNKFNMGNQRDYLSNGVKFLFEDPVNGLEKFFKSIGVDDLSIHVQSLKKIDFNPENFFNLQLPINGGNGFHGGNPKFNQYDHVLYKGQQCQIIKVIKEKNNKYMYQIVFSVDDNKPMKLSKMTVVDEKHLIIDANFQKKEGVVVSSFNFTKDILQTLLMVAFCVVLLFIAYLFSFYVFQFAKASGTTSWWHTVTNFLTLGFQSVLEDRRFFNGLRQIKNTGFAKMMVTDPLTLSVNFFEQIIPALGTMTDSQTLSSTSVSMVVVNQFFRFFHANIKIISENSKKKLLWKHIASDGARLSIDITFALTTQFAAAALAHNQNVRMGAQVTGIFCQLFFGNPAISSAHGKLKQLTNPIEHQKEMDEKTEKEKKEKKAIENATKVKMFEQFFKNNVDTNNGPIVEEPPSEGEEEEEEEGPKIAEIDGGARKQKSRRRKSRTSKRRRVSRRTNKK